MGNTEIAICIFTIWGASLITEFTFIGYTIVAITSSATCPTAAGEAVVVTATCNSRDGVNVVYALIIINCYSTYLTSD